MDKNKKAKRIYFGRDGECMAEAKKSEGYNKEIILVNEFHGEYDLDWFIVIENGLEIARHNAKFVETIEWEVL